MVSFPCIHSIFFLLFVCLTPQSPPSVNPNRGNVLFAKQAQKSEEWIIDDVAEQVIDAARDKLFRNVKHGSISSSPIPPMSPHYSRYSSPIAGPVFTPLDSSLPSTRPSSAMGSIYSRFKDFNSRPKPFGQAYWSFSHLRSKRPHTNTHINTSEMVFIPYWNNEMIFQSGNDHSRSWFMSSK